MNMGTKSSISVAIRLLVAILLLSGLSLQANGQGRVSNYTVSTFSGSFSSISGSATALGYDDDQQYNFASPFAIVYDSVNFAAGTTIFVNDNGSYGLGAGGYQYYSLNPVGNSSYPQELAVAATDLNHYHGAGNYWTVTGSSPNRVLIMENYTASGYGYSSESTSYQCKIYETSNVIEYWYSDYGYDCNGSDSWGGVAIGLNGTSTNGFKSLSYSSGTTTPSTNLRFTPPPPPLPPAELSVQPKSVNFGSLLTGQIDTMCVTVADVGPNIANYIPLTINAIYLSGVPDYHIITPSWPTTLNPGQSFQVCISFQPAANGGRSGTLNVVTNGRDSGTQYVNLSGSGIAPQVGYSQTRLFFRTPAKIGHCISQTVLITSTGQGPLGFTGVTIGGYYPGEYSIARYPAASIPAGTSDSLVVNYCPTLEGLHSATLFITTNAINIPIDTIQMTGIGILPRLLVTPSPLNFDSVAIGATQCDSLLLTNPGTDTLYITRNYLSSSDGDYTLTPLTSPDTVILPDHSKYVKICFTPLSRGLRQARFRVTTNIPMTFDSPVRDTSAFSVNIIGEGVPFGILSVKGTSIVDSQIIGKQLCMTDTFYNTGTADLKITGVTLNGVDSADYALGSSLPLPITVAAGGKYVFNVCATPSARGDRNATLNVTAVTSGSKKLSQALSIDVYGQLVCASANPTSVFKKPTCIGSSDTAYVQVTNCGDAASTYTSALGTGATGYTLVVPTTSTTISANGIANFGVVFSPTVAGTATSTMNITSSAGATAMTVNLNGVGAAATVAGAGNAPTTQVNHTSDQFMVIVTNTGQCEWTPGIPTTDSLFTYVSGANPIPPGGSDTLIFTFSPTSTGTFTMDVHFPAASGATTVAPIVTITGTSTLLGVGHLTAADGFSLEQNYPNPFNPTTEIRFVLAKESQVKLEIIDVSGRVVRTVLDGHMTQGNHGTVINAAELSSGVYYYRLTAGSIQLTRQMMLSK
jgi:hypothetical protein